MQAQIDNEGAAVMDNRHVTKTVSVGVGEIDYSHVPTTSSKDDILEIRVIGLEWLE